MSLLQEILKESATGGATGGGAVASHAGSLFGGGMIDRIPNKSNVGSKLTSIQRFPGKKLKTLSKNKNAMNWKVLGEMMDDKYDPADVISKLDAAERKARQDSDTIPFGMEDENGNIVKVYVRAEQADEFEIALSSLLAGEDENENGISDGTEIAEVLFQLKDKFEIVDVEWPEIEGDEEEEQEVEGDAPEGDMEGDLGDAPEGDMEGGEEDDPFGGEEGLDAEGPEGDMEMEPEGGAASALDKVIDMMKSDAEARKAESEARTKEAEARTAEANANAAASKVKQEEEVLDMETYNKQQKEEEEEAKTLAKLAKFKHDRASKAEVLAAREEEEERLCADDLAPSRTTPSEREDETLSRDELMSKILTYLKANN